MPKRKDPYPDRPWKPDPTKWEKLLEPKKEDVAKRDTPTEPKGGWMLFNWQTLEDVKQ